MAKRQSEEISNTKSKKQKTDNSEEWQSNFINLKQYIDINEKLPSTRSKYIDVVKLAKWYYDQKYKYTNRIGIMKNEEIRKQWDEFMTEYYDKIKSNITWEKTLDKIKNFIKTHGKPPSRTSLNNEHKYLARWLDNQKQRINVKDDKIRKMWDEFIKEYMMSNSNDWDERLQMLKDYMDTNKETPSQCDEDYEIRRLALWLSRQKQYYKTKNMKEEYLLKWEEFIDSHGHYILSSEEEWYIKLHILKKYINENQEKPRQKSHFLGNWLYMQQQYYKSNRYNMKHDRVREKWEEFNRDYKKYLVPTEVWNCKLVALKSFIDKNNKLPPKNCELYNWIKTQQKNNRNKRLKEEYKALWNDFVREYNKYFQTKDFLWFNLLDKVKLFINENNNFPSPYHKNKSVRLLGKWLEKQHVNYNKQVYLLRNVTIKETWERFKEEYYTPDKYWKNALNNVVHYISTYKKIPSDKSPNKNIRGLYVWMNAQYNNYHKNFGAMKNEELRELWKQFLIDHDEIIIFN